MWNTVRISQFIWLLVLGLAGMAILLYTSHVLPVRVSHGDGMVRLDGTVTEGITPTEGDPTALVNLSVQGNIRWILGTGETLLDRVHEYGEALLAQRRNFILSKSSTKDRFQWMEDIETVQPIVGKIESIFKLQHNERIQTLALAWVDARDVEDTSERNIRYARNLLVLDYYKVAESQAMCIAKRVEESNTTCLANQTVPLQPEAIREVALNPDSIKRELLVPRSSKLFSDSVEVGPLPHMLFLHLIHNAVVDNLGDVFIGDFKIIPRGCREHIRLAETTLPKSATHGSPLYDEVFVITQFWSDSPFHNMCESLPRVAPYRDFLKAHPNIKIHIMQDSGSWLSIMDIFGGKHGRGLTSDALELLGLDPTTRFVSGVVRAKTVYVPQGSRCGRPHVHLAQLLSHEFRMAIREKYPSEMLQRNSIVVIQRTKKRMFKNASEIETMVKRMAEEKGFRFELFTDKPLPKFEEIALMFSRAVIVVAPHGAGISNVLFSEPGTFVIEGVCNPPNICFEDLAYKLGHRYHGVMTSGGCHTGIDISSETIAEVLKIYIEHLKAKTDVL